MDREETYVKTDKGSEEIKNRNYKLPQAMRSLLNMINGTTPAGAFLDRAASMGDVASMLAELEKQGFIKKTEAPVRPQAPAPPSQKERVMDREETYVKTDKGSEEIKNRNCKLPQAMRSLLNMINDTTPAGAFLDRAASLGDVASMLAELEKQGFIKKTEAPVRPQAPAPPSQKERVKEQPPSGDGALIDLVGLFNPGEKKEEGKKS